MSDSPCTWYIYALSDPRTSDIRYVGWSLNPHKRLKAHINQAKRGGTHKSHWIQQLMAEGLRPLMHIVESGTGDYEEAERRWIAYYKNQGYRLTNLTIGGEGAPGYNPPAEVRAKMSVAQTGRKQTPESIAKTAAALRGRKQSPEHIAKLSKVRKGKIPQAATDAAAKANRGRQQDQEHIKKRIAPLVGKIRPEIRKLSPTEVKEIRAARGTVSQRALAKQYGVGVATINEILHNRAYSDVIED